MTRMSTKVLLIIDSNSPSKIVMHIMDHIVPNYFFFDNSFFIIDFLVLVNTFLVLFNILDTFLVLVDTFLAQNRDFFALGLLLNNSNTLPISERNLILLCNS